MTNPIDIKELIKSEYKKCAVDPIYFLKKYGIIQHPIRGKIPFHLYAFQEDVINDFLKNDYNIVLKARQIGLSTVVAGYATWLMLFHGDKNILVIATKQETAKNLVTKVKVLHSALPVWLRGTTVEDNKLSMRFSNGSQIKAVASSEDAGRSESLSLLILDEAAFIDNAEVIWTAASNTLSTGGRAIILSTPNGIGNFFHKKWIEATEGEKSESHFKFNPIFLNWKVHPERDEEWRKRQDEIQGSRSAAQEHDADFISSGDTFIPGETILHYKNTFVKDPVEKTWIDGNLWKWEYPNYSKNYILCADVARGDAADKSAFHIIEQESARQVAEYRGSIGTKDFGNLIINVATEYNDAFVIVDNSSVGWNAIQVLIDRGYKNLFYSTEDLYYVDAQKQATNKLYHQQKKSVPGFSTTSRTRPLILSKLYEYMKDMSVVIQSIRTIDELFVFIWNKDKAEARDGYNDDLVMALSMGLWVRDTALRLRQEGIELNRAALQSIKRQTHDAVYTKQSMPDHNPWQMDLGVDKLNLKDFL